MHRARIQRNLSASSCSLQASVFVSENLKVAPFRWFSLCRGALNSSLRQILAVLLLASCSVLAGCGGGEEPAAETGGAAAAEGAAAGGGGGMAMAPPPDGSESSDAGGAMAGGMQSGPPGGMPMGAMGGPPDEMTAGGAAAGPAGEMAAGAAGAAGGAGGFQLPGGAPVKARGSDVSKWTDEEMKDAVRQSDRRVIQAIDARVKSKPGDPATAALLLELLAVSTEPPPTPVMPAGSAAAGGYPGMQGMAPGGMPGMLGGSSAAGFSGVPSSGGGAPPGLSEMSAGASAGGQNSSAPPGVVPSSGGASAAPPGLAPPQSSIRRRPPQDSIGAMLAEYATAYQANPAVGAMRGGFKVPGPGAGAPGSDGGLSGAPGDGIVPGGIGMPPGMGGDGIVPGGIGMPPGMGGGEMSGGDLFSGAGGGAAPAAPAATLTRELVSAVADGLIQNGSEEAWQSLFAIVSGSAKSPVSLEENAEIVTVSLIKNLDVDPQQVSQVIVAIIDGTAPLPPESRVSSLNTMAELAGRSLDKLTGLSPAAASGLGGGELSSGGGMSGMAGMMGAMMGGGGMPGMPGMSEGMAGGLAGGMSSMAGMRGGSMPGMPQMPGVAGAGPVGGAPGMGPPGMPSMPGVSGAGPVSGAPGMLSMGGPPGGASMPGVASAGPVSGAPGMLSMGGPPGMPGGELSAGGGPMSGMGMPGMGQPGMGQPGMGMPGGMGQTGIPTGPAQAVGLQAATEAIVTKARLLLWSKPCIDAVAGALQQAGDLTSADGLLKLAASIPAEPVRDAEFAFFQKIHSTGSDSLNSNGFFLTAAHDPGLLAVLKSLPRSKGSRDDEGQSAMDSWALSSQQLVLTYVDQLRAMSQAPGSKLSPNQKGFPVRPHRNAEFDFTGQIRISPNAANPAEAAIAETRIYYARAAFSPKKARDSEDVMKHYKSAVSGVQRSDQARALTWLDGGKSGGTGMRRSMDVIIREGTVGSPAGGADGGRMGGMAGPTGGEFAGGGAMGGGAGGNYVIEVVIVEIADPQPEAAVGAASEK